MKKVLLLAALLAHALAALAPLSDDALKRFVQRETASLRGRVEVSIGRSDFTRSAPCAKLEPYVVPGTRLWGKTAVGVRCADGNKWSAFVLVEVKVFAPAWVAARPVPAGRPVTEAD